MKKLAISLFLVLLFSNIVTAATPTFSHPLLSSARVSYNFNTQPRPFSNGMLWSAPNGTRVFAAADGSVVRIEFLTGLGMTIELMHLGGFTTVYGHLSKVSVAQGSIVKQGDVIGSSGDTGNAFEPGLYFEIRKDGIALNPLGHLLQGTSAIQGDSTAESKYFLNQPLGWSDWIWGTNLSDFGVFMGYVTGFPEEDPLIDAYTMSGDTNTYLHMYWDAVLYCFIDDLFVGVILIDEYTEGAAQSDNALSLQYGKFTRDFVKADGSIKSWEGEISTVFSIYMAADEVSPAAAIVHIGTNTFIDTILNANFGVSLDNLFNLLPKP